MAKDKHVSHIDHKGKPSGNGREIETLREAGGETQENNDLNTGELEIQHLNRHLHKGEELKTFKDDEEE